MKKTLSILLCLIMLFSVFGAAFNAYADSVPEEGWYKDLNGKWHYALDGKDITEDVFYDEEKDKLYYFDANGILAEKKWTKIVTELDDGYNQTVWIYSNKGGALAQGWKKIDGSWYYFAPAMLSGGGYFIDESGKCYVFEKSGELTKKTGWVSYKEYVGDGEYHKYWYYVVKGGVAYTGWKNINSSWYYFDDTSGAMLDDGVYRLEKGIYFFNTNGKLDDSISGWVEDYGDMYYFVKGRGITGWKKLNGSWYCFDIYYGTMYKDGVFEVFKTENDERGTFYAFEKDGKLTNKTGWQKYEYENFFGETYTGWHYIEKGGKAAIGWRKIKNNWYYFDEQSSLMVAETGWRINNKTYLFNKSGKLVTKTGWVSMDIELFDGTTHKYWFYTQKGGVCVTGWKTVKNVTYYFNIDSGAMLDDGVYFLDDGIFYFNSDGSLDKTKAGLVEDYEDYYYFIDGKGVTGWYELDGENRYFDVYTGAMARNGEWEIDGYIYEFDDEGNATLIGEAPHDFQINFAPPHKTLKSA